MKQLGLSLAGLFLLLGSTELFGAVTKENVGEISRQVVATGIFPVNIPEPATVLFLVLGGLSIFALKKRGIK